MKRLVALLLLSFASAPLAAAPAMYRYDTVHSQVLFSVSHNDYAHPVGRLHIAGGWLRFDPDDLEHAATVLDIDLGSADMGDAEWNRAVRGHDFLAASGHRLAHFRSTSVTRTGKRSGILHGLLTLRGVTRKVNVAFTINRVGSTVFGMHRVAGFSGRATLIRDAFGMRRFPDSIGHRVDIRLEIEAIADTDAKQHYRQLHPQAPAHATEKQR